MKTQKKLLALALLITSLSFGQITTDPGTGNIGIGTASPQSKLQVAGSITLPLPGTSEISEEGISFVPNHRFNYDGKFINHYGFGFYPYSKSSYVGGVNAYMSGYYGLDFFTQDINRIRIDQGGNVGIGTTSPTAKLEVAGDAKINGILNIVGLSNAGYEIGSFKLQSTIVNQFMYFGYDDRYSAGYIQSVKPGTEQQNILLAPAGGNVGIGSTAPDQKLTVKGKIHAEEIIVDLAVPADYVFQKYYTGKSTLKSDYVMPTLAEIESFTKKNHHLPNVPSAQEVQQNGVSLGKMSNVLLQKVEELTLYVIEQNKELERLKKENENYKSLAERLSSLEKALKK